MARYVRRDRFYEKAQSEGYRSRAIFKLRELLERAGPLSRDAAVVELGCWPGGWLQGLAERASAKALVIGVDLREPDPLPGVQLLQLDFTEPESAERIREALGGRPADALLSDAAPKLSGIRDVDRAAAEELYEAALGLAHALLRPGGLLIAKGFPGPGAEAFRRELRSAFGRVSQTKPEGSRRSSQEFYWIARDFRPPAPSE